MSQQTIQPSFAAGEVSPNLYARLDLAKFHVGAKLLRNFFIHLAGGASNRAGTEFVGRCKDSSHPVHLIPFQFNLLQTYQLEFGHRYMRVVMNGGHVLEPAKNITGVTQASPGVVTAVAHGFSNGDQVFISNVGGMTRLNSTPGRQYLIADATADTFTLTDLDGNPIDTTGFDAYTSGGTVARVYTLTTPYDGDDVALLKWTQSADTLTLTHPKYPPYDLTRLQHYQWNFTSITFQPGIVSPGGLVGTPGGTGTWNYVYTVTAVSDAPPSESLATTSVQFSGAQLNQNTGVANMISWTAVPGAARYKVYKTRPSISPIPWGASYGYIGTAMGTSFTDENIAPDFTQTPPQGQNPFPSTGEYPGVSTYFQQRKTFGGSNNRPQTMWLTQPGDYGNMDISDPSRPSDALTITIAANQVHAIKWFVPVADLIVLTSGGAWRVSAGSGSGNALTPSQTVVTPQSYTGCGDLPPIVVNHDILYVQSKGSIIRDLSYNFYANIYTGIDLTTLSSHLFLGYMLKRWCFAEEPYKLIYAVRSDGKILFLTYLKEQEVYAWSWGDTPGNSGTDKFESVASISESVGNGTAEDVVYAVITRTIPGVNGGQPVKYIERFHTRNFLVNGQADVARVWFVDCGAQYVGPPTTEVSGLEHLEGCTVSILADGNLQPAQVVTNGRITIQFLSSIIVVGLPYKAQLRTLSLDPEGAQGLIQASRKKISAVTLRVENTRGLKVGPAFDTLREMKERTAAMAFGQAIPLFTADERLTIDSQYRTSNEICIEQSNPLPCTILGVIPDVKIGDTPG